MNIAEEYAKYADIANLKPGDFIHIINRPGYARFPSDLLYVVRNVGECISYNVHKKGCGPNGECSFKGIYVIVSANFIGVSVCDYALTDKDGRAYRRRQ